MHSQPSGTNQPRDLASCIEHTLLKPGATPQQIDQLCDEAIGHNFFAICVNPIFVRRAADRLANSKASQIVVSVAGFPLGASTTSVKVAEAKAALDDGAMEIDMVLPIGLLIAGDNSAVRSDIEAVATSVHRFDKRRLLKVIFETAALDTDAIIRGCRCCAEAEADFVKTSTGFHPAGGATVEHVRLLHRHAAPIRVKAAGGIRTAAAAIAMLEAGASRIGTSVSCAIIEEWQGLYA
ncbi:MAG: deoxyribose-phosphate aldolase [Planctomycetes bacterium]|nr:deoxyribose-phosphate aldolase [Planctomycetota bacterium]MBI3835765.1 deoxyribose-phosphate aldolase [Planctomycetota bacterium]